MEPYVVAAIVGAFAFGFLVGKALGKKETLERLAFQNAQVEIQKAWEANMKQYGQWRKEDEQDD
jgi:hypothetical protein